MKKDLFFVFKEKTRKKNEINTGILVVLKQLTLVKICVIHASAGWRLAVGFLPLIKIL